MNSIRKKITVCLMATVLVSLIAVGAASSALSYRNTVATVDQMMSETAALTASASSTARTTRTGNMSGRPCRAMPMCPNR